MESFQVEEGDQDALDVRALCGNPQSTCLLAMNSGCQGEDCSRLVPALVFPFLAIVCGLVLQPLASRSRLPYTSLLMVVGAIMGVLGCSVEMALLTDSLRIWTHISPPTLFFHIFLAPIVFESAFNADTHLFTKSIKQILYLAFAIVTIQIVLVAVFQLYVIRSPDWGWFSALMYGSMLSATDPISVTAILKEIGAGEALNTVIEGESLFNDGSAVVFFEAFLLGAISGEGSAGEIIVEVIRLSLGGFAMGLAFGFIAVIFLSFVYELFEVEVSVTLVVAFLGFWTAQSSRAFLSGVICNVTSGIVLGAYGKQLVSPSVRDPLRSFWQLIGWLANTIVFVYAGLLVVAYIWSCAGDPLEWYDYVHILSYYAFLNVLRFVLVFLSHPIMKYDQKWYGWKQATVLSYSGLRGAVTLILALEVGDENALPVNVKSRVVVWSSAVVALTLFINGTTSKSILHYLRLDRPDPIKEEFLWRARASMLAKTYEILDIICVDHSFKECAWSTAAKAVVPDKWHADIDRVTRAYAASLDMARGSFSLTTYNPADSVRVSRRFSMSTTGNPRYSISRSSMDHFQFQRKTSRQSFGQGAHDLRQVATFERRDSASGASEGASLDSPVKRGSDYGREMPQKMDELEAKALHFPHEIGEERDIEVRRRMLTSLLGIFREAYETSLVNYFHLSALTEDIKLALDSNEEGETYDLFAFLGDQKKWFNHPDSLLRIFKSLEDRIQPISRKLFATSHRQGRISLATMIVSALKHVLCEPFMKESELVLKEAKTTYEITLGYLNRLEASCGSDFAKIQTDSVVRYVFKNQMQSLEEMRQQGVIDTEEMDTIRDELVSIQRTYFLKTAKFSKKVELKDREILRNMPLLRPLDHETFLSSVVERGKFVKFQRGEAVRVKPGWLVFVLRGAVRVNDTKMNPQMHLPSEESVLGDEGEKPAQSVSSTMHTCFSRNSILLPTDFLSGSLNPLPQISCCEIYGHATLFMLPGSQAQELAHSFEWFRAELGRNITRLILLNFLAESPSYTKSFEDADENENENESSPYVVATHILQTLPYSSLLGLTKKHGSAKIQGPGVLLQGKLTVSRRDFQSFVLDEEKVISEEFYSPSILPPGLLSIELLSSEESDELELAEILVQDIASPDVIAEDRIRRWNAAPGLVETNGRFGLHRHINLQELAAQHPDSGADNGELDRSGEELQTSNAVLKASYAEQAGPLSSSSENSD
mmetsp:Transcript_6654/g.20158  ORF Transcript_6654/g.20158 Transcript_6654/m.20158 type:complete len:1222 (+) Transcript_6654:86-3751(+)